jgi:hypothetical protein
LVGDGEADTATAQQQNHNNSDDDAGVTFLRLFGGNRHFIHELFSSEKLFRADEWACAR